MLKQTRHIEDNVKETEFNKQTEVLARTDHILSFDMIRTAQKATPQTILRCRGTIFTKMFP
jgi:hypothetical protein